MRLGRRIFSHEPIGSGPLAIGAFAAFCLLIIGAALIPAHAEQLEPDQSTPPTITTTLAR